MIIKIPKLHNQILIALLLGAVFGALFSVNKNVLIVKYKEHSEIKSMYVNDWASFNFLVNEANRNDTITFKSDEQLAIISFSKKMKAAKDNFTLIVKKIYPKKNNFQLEVKIENVISVQKEMTVPMHLKWFGDLFIRLLNMIAVPLVLASLTVGAASLGDIKKFARIGGKTLFIYITTTMLAIIIGLILANIIKPGNRMEANTKKELLSIYEGDAKSKIDVEYDFDLGKEINNIVPKNPFAALSSAEMMQIVFFAVLLGIILTSIDKTKANFVIGFFDGLSDTMIKMVDVVMLIAPIAVFALIASIVSEFGFEILQTLFWYALTVLLGLVIHTFGVYSLLIKLFSKIKVYNFFKGLRKVQTIAFTTSSSAATLPVNLECCQQNLGVSKSITSFVLPLGATINMDGTALYQGVASVFIAQVFGIELSLGQQITIVFMATLASIGTAPVPGVGIIMLVIILKSVGIPEEGIALIIGIDRILDMCRTVTNVTGDAMTAVVVATSEKEISDVNLETA